MIDLGNFVIRDITLGNFVIRNISLGNYTIWPSDDGGGGGGTDYITLSSYSASIGSGSNSSNIYVTASTTAWTVSTSDSSWLTVSKSSGTMARYSAAQNGGAARTGYIYFIINSQTAATFTITQNAAAPYLNISPTGATPDYLATAGTITVDTNLSSWNVYENYNWITVTKGTNKVTWNITENTNTATRQGWIVISGGTISKEFQLTQYAGYVFQFAGGGTSQAITVSSGAGTVAVSVRSEYHSNPLPVSSAIGRNDIGLQLQSFASGSGYFNYTFHYNARTATTSGMAAVTFTQQGTSKTVGFQVYQNPMYVPTEIPGVHSAATYGDWVLGTITTSYTTTGLGPNQPVNGIYIVAHNPITSDYHAYIGSMVYQTGPMNTGQTPTSYTLEAQTYEIPANSTFTVSGTTYYGKMIVSPTPRQQINAVQQFSVF